VKTYLQLPRSRLCQSPRNVSDACLDKLKQNKGIIMISFIPALTQAEASRADINHVVDHIEYVARRIGFDHIGIGTDFDGMERSVGGLEDVSKFPDLVALMLSRGINRGDVEKVIGHNVIRVLRDVERVAEERDAKLPVLEDKVEQLWDDNIRAYVRRVYPDRG
jgi:membrane dipeptidase